MPLKALVKTVAFNGENIPVFLDEDENLFLNILVCGLCVRIANEILMFFRNQKKSAQDVYISDPIDTDKEGNALSLIDVIADKSDIVEELDTKFKLQKLKSILNKTLDKRELEIIELRYGIGSNPELTQREIAKKLGISRSYVSRIEKSALEKLRKQF